MNWISLNEEAQLSQILEKSTTVPQVIFKHSTRCSVSSMVLSRLERADKPENIDFYLLDLIKYRKISNRIVEDFKVYHESPQVLLIKNRECVYDESHMSINMGELADQAAKN